MKILIKKGTLDGVFSNIRSNINYIIITVKRSQRTIKKAPNSTNELWCTHKMWR